MSSTAAAVRHAHWSTNSVSWQRVVLTVAVATSAANDAEIVMAQPMVATIDGRQDALVDTQTRVHLRLGSP